MTHSESAADEHFETASRDGLRQGAASGTRASLPRLLIFDMTAMGDGTATGELKASLFTGWPRESLLQICANGPNGAGVAGETDRRADEPSNEPASQQQLRGLIARFDPELILYRPVPKTPALHQIAMKTIQSLPALPLVTWIMDDWPVSLEEADPAGSAALGEDLLWLLDRSRLRLSIGEKMSRVFEQRYGVPFEAFANGVDPADWPERGPSPSDAFVLRYSGALAEDMTARTVRRVAVAVESLADEGHPIRFEIRTKPLWRDSQREYYTGLSHTTFFTDLLSPSEYRNWLISADCVLVAYNFDDRSLRYIWLSLANKMPECLASGAPLVAVGPLEAATISYLKDNDCALVIDRDTVSDVRDGLRQLLQDRDFGRRLGDSGRRHAFSQHDLSTIRQRFFKALSTAAHTTESPSPMVRRTSENVFEKAYSRDAQGRINETAVIACLLSNRRGSQHVMIDVGAHHGTSAALLHPLGWKIFCFEPDAANREKLEARFRDAENVRIDPRAVSDSAATNVEFFKSEQSTGISALHAFHDSHEEAGRVDVTTIAEIVRSQAIDRIDFLKIDVEGFDFSVIKGVPWDDIKPDAIECEFEDAKTLRLGHSWRDIADFLTGKGYAVYVSEWHPIKRYGIAHDWLGLKRYPCDLDSADAWGNLMAFREDPGEEAIASAIAECVSVGTTAVAASQKPGILPAIILGNGPSLKDFEFARFEGFDVFGMNAAYRYWDRIGWYPQYYSCLDTVVGISHASEIRRLIENAPEYGIRQFLLRQNLIDVLGEIKNSDRIVNFDLLRRGVEVLSSPTISTGSHTAAWAVHLGYERVYLMGIDCDYVEMVPGAVRGQGIELEIAEPIGDNPNYFFADYQQPGDKYNVPNPGRNVHLISWRELAWLLRSRSASILNANLRSKVDAFCFCRFEDIEKGGAIEAIPPQDVLGPLAGPEHPRDEQANVDETEVVSRILSSRRGPDHLMLDVGAHFGESATYFDTLGWTITCFEPDPRNRKKLQARLGGSSTVTIDPRAVGEQSSKAAAFFTSNESSGISALHAFRESHKQTATVDVTTIGDVLAAHPTKTLDFLKIDVEGFDFSVLKGVPWDKIRPDVIECEFEDAKTVLMGHSWRDVAEYLRELGYAVYVSEWHPIVRYGVAHDWRRVVSYPCDDIPDGAWGNLLAFRVDPGFGVVSWGFEKTLKDRADDRRRRTKGKRRGRKASPVKQRNRPRAKQPPKKRNIVARFARSMPISTAAIVASLVFAVIAALLPGPASEEALVAYGPWVVAALIGLLAYEHLRRGMRKQVLRIRRQSVRRAARQKQEIRITRKSLQRIKKAGRKYRRSARAKIASIKADRRAQESSASDLKIARARLERQVEALTRGLDKVEKRELPASRKATAFLRERVAAGEKQIEAIRYPDAPPCIAFFGHHKCASRFFREEVFSRISEMTGAKFRHYKIANPPFHYSRMDDLDLCNMDFDNIGAVGRDVVLFANASARSLEKLREVAPDWKAIRVVRDPRQVLVSDYFHHKGDHSTESPLGWVWDTLKRDKPILLKLPKEEGLLYELDHITKEVIEEEILGPFDDERILTLKLEDFAAAPRLHLVRISEFLEIADIAGIDLSKTFANRNSGYWGDHFTPKLKAVFKERYGQALIDLGYERDMDW
ncbi:MAG: FkbM family methyltransferase [Bauldia litoralis]